MAELPCRNPECRSLGQPHPHCKCYGPDVAFAAGGVVCNGPHKEDCLHFADGGQVEENHDFLKNPSKSIDHVSITHGLLGLLTKVGHSRSENPHKHFQDYVETSKKGHKVLHGHMKSLLGSHKGTSIEPDKNSREALRSHLNHIKEHPESLLEVGGQLGDVLPDHAAVFAGKMGAATNYLNSLKPMQTKTHPLDDLAPVSKGIQGHYDRALDIAQNPMLILQHVKDGTLRPDDISVLRNLYPELQKSIVSKASEALITAQSENKEIPYKQKQTLSLLLDQPLDSTMTPQSMQAIIKSAAPQQMKNQQKNTQPKKASAAELSQINKVIKNDETPLQARLMNRKD